jgi:hypothetical protein
MAVRRPFVAIALALAVALPIAARAELAKWDQAKVQALAKQLIEGAKNLEDVFYKKPTPTIGSGDSRDYYRLKQTVRRIRQDATSLNSDLEKGEGMEQTLPGYESLMESVRDAREVGGRIFATQDIKDAATKVRATLNELSPYYDPDAVPLQPVTR